MAFYASFDIDYDSKRIGDYLREFFGNCECMAHMPEGLLIHLHHALTQRIEVKDLKKVAFGDDHMAIYFKDDVAKKDCIIKYDSIVFLEVLPPDIARWSD